MNVDKIANELKKLETFIDGRAIDPYTSYTVKMYISNLKNELGIEKKKEDEIVFSYEDDISSCKIIKQGINNTYILEIVEKENNYIWNSLKDGVKFTNDGVYDSFEDCMKELEESYESIFGNKLKLKNE
jgi:hypothetical protein